MPSTAAAVSSFSKALALGEIHEDMVFPYPPENDEEGPRIRELVSSFREYAKDHIDSRKIDDERWIDDQIFRDLGEMGLMGLYVPKEYGGAGLSQTGYARVFEAFGQVDGSLTVALGVHQSIGMKGIVLFGSDEQKARFLPDLATGRQLAAFALTEPSAGSDAFHVQSRAVLQSDGSWVLNGEKRYIGNGSRASVLVTFARAEVDGEDKHVALIVTNDMEGFEVGDRYDTMGLKGNDLRKLRFNDVRVPAENLLGEPGDGFRIAMQILNNGRMSLGTGSVGLGKRLIDLTIEHVKERRQFGNPLADLDMVEDKVAWMVTYLFGLESMSYLTTGLVDQGMGDYSLESAMCKVTGTEFIWYQANRAMQLKGGEGYMRYQPYEQIMRDIRIFPIFEGANDVMRSYIALTALKPLGDELKELTDLDLRNPLSSLGAVADYVVGRVQREVRPDRITKAHDELKSLADAIPDQVVRLRDAGESLLRKHGNKITEQGMSHKRYSHALMDLYAQIAVISRVTAILDGAQGPDASSQELYIAQTFCTRAERRVMGALDQLETNDDQRMHAIARMAYQRGDYGYALFED